MATDESVIASMEGSNGTKSYYLGMKIVYSTMM